MPAYRFILTRDVTESAAVDVSAPSASEAYEALMHTISPRAGRSSNRAEVGPVEWDHDECTGGTPYLTGVEKNGRLVADDDDDFDNFARTEPAEVGTTGRGSSVDEPPRNPIERVVNRLPLAGGRRRGPAR